MVNYSKWDRLELSDDEDNFHPNIDNNLMIRLQREKRQQREDQEHQRLEHLKKQQTPEAQQEIDKINRLRKLHVDNICVDKFSSKHTKQAAAASSKDASSDAPKSDDKPLKVAALEDGAFVSGYDEFLAKSQPTLDEYAAIDEDDERSEAYILEHTELLSEHATGYYLLHCISLQAEGKTRAMRKAARQYLLLTYVCDLAKTMPGRDARDAIKPLFYKMARNAESREAFNQHLETYIEHVKTRAEVKKKEDAERAAAAAEEEEAEYVTLQKGEQVGPGGLDPAEVFETLPEAMQEAFGERDIDALKKVLAEMDPDEAQKHMQRCIDSGLWDPGSADADEKDGPDDDAPSAEVDD